MKILIIEDEPSLREIMQRALVQERYVVETASTYSEADAKIAAYSYDCILLDIMLPDGNGLQLLKHLKELRKRENIIIISARDSLDDKILGLDMGADDYPPHYFLFSNNIMPGNVQVDRRLITIRWTRLKKELKLDKDYTFYSLKDTGITEMLDKKLSNISVRDQARHSSLAVTDVYTRHRDNADKAILDLDGTL